MRLIFFVLISTIWAALFLMATSVEAAGSQIVFDQKPQMSKSVFGLNEPVSIDVNVHNASSTSLTTPLCVREQVGSLSIHKGCVPSVAFGTNSDRKFSFNVTRTANPRGTHMVIFSYKDASNRWHEILSSSQNRMRISYRVV